MADNGVNDVINKCVDEIWSKYDTDNSGALDKEETKKFVSETLQDMSAGDGGVDESEFEKTFNEFDKDGNGTIEKDEMVAFIKKVAGL